jgi:hypothetical protein
MRHSIEVLEIPSDRNPYTGAAPLRPSLPGREHKRDLVFLSPARHACIEALFTSALASFTLFL